MKSIKLHINYCSDSVFMLNKQKTYSFAFRKAYSLFDKHTKKELEQILKDKFSLTDIEVRSIIMEVGVKIAQRKTDLKKKK